MEWKQIDQVLHKRSDTGESSLTSSCSQLISHRDKASLWDNCDMITSIPAPHVWHRSGSHSRTAMKHGHCFVLHCALQRHPGNRLWPTDHTHTSNNTTAHHATSTNTTNSSNIYCSLQKRFAINLYRPQLNTMNTVNIQSVTYTDPQAQLTCHTASLFTHRYSVYCLSMQIFCNILQNHFLTRKAGPKKPL